MTAVSRSTEHTFSKFTCESIRLLAGLGVEGDAHLGKTVKHRSQVAADPNQPNLRQIYLVHSELHEELRAAGFEIPAGQMGENVTARDVDLPGLPTSTRLYLGDQAVVEVTGLRSPCRRLEGLQPGLMEAVLDQDEDGNLVDKTGVMGIVVADGEVSVGDEIRVELPPEPHRPLERV